MCGDMITVSSSQQRVVDRRRLHVEHVEAGAGEVPGRQCGVQRRLVDDAAARRVDDERASASSRQPCQH